MEFRTRGKSVQVLRTELDGEGGEAKPKVIGSLKGPEFAVDEALQAKLSAEELDEVAAYGARQKLSERLSRDYAALKFAENVRYAHDWLRAASKAEAASFVEETREPLIRLRRVIAKVGGANPGA